MKENTVFPGSIGAMIEPIIPAVLSVQSQGGDLVHNSVRANVSRTVNRLRTTSKPILLNPLREGRLRIVGAVYDMDDGSVDFFDEA